MGASLQVILNGNFPGEREFFQQKVGRGIVYFMKRKEK
jgi:hypothetical protein